MFEPLFTAPVAVQIHVGCALLALLLTPVQFLRRVGDRRHKRIGYAWVVAMGLTALSSFGISEIRLLGPFGPIHLLSAWVLFALVAAIMAARAGNIAAHSAWLRNSAFWGLGVAGLFTLLPARRMGQTLFADVGWLGFAAACGLFAAGSFGIMVRRARQAASARTR